MKKKNLYILVIFLLLDIVIVHKSLAQGMIVNTVLEERIRQSELVIEGKVIGHTVSWDEDYRNIYTANLILVLAKIKGDVFADTIIILTRGGIVGDSKQIDFPSLTLGRDDLGLFILNRSRIGLRDGSKTLPTYVPSYSRLSFIRYDISTGSASDDFLQYNDIERDVYGRLQAIGYTITRLIEKMDAYNTDRNPNAISISSFTPTILTSGTQTVLTINGSGFGATQGTGKVEFFNANNGGSSYMAPIASEYISWSDSQIKVEVPTGAGTGNIKVTNNAGDFLETTSFLTVDYNLTNIEYSSEMYRINLVDADGSGGLEFVFFTDFYNNTAAKAAFIRALDSWRCGSLGGTEVYFADGASSTVDQAANDDVNIVRFDSGSELPSGVLGRTTSRYTGCSSAGITKWYLEEADIVFDDNAGGSSYTWNYDEADNSTTSSEYDFETVAVHEQGHVHQLGHVIDASQVMHYSVSNGQEKRYLSSTDVNAGNDVLSYSSGVCGMTSMNFYVCSTLPLEFLYFEASKGENKIDLKWEIEGISDLDRVIVQKSNNGIDFSQLKEIFLIDNPVTDKFSFVDYTIDRDNYYRLKASDRDGIFFFSEIVFIHSNKADQTVAVYPNPVTDKLTLINDLGVGVDIQLLDSRGKLLIELNSLEKNGRASFDLRSIPQGVYIVRFISDQKIISKVIVKR